jgi:hypothetical protein
MRLATRVRGLTNWVIVRRQHERQSEAMKRHVRTLLAGTVLLALVAVLAVAALTHRGAAPQAHAHGPVDPPDAQVITNYVAALNAGIQSGDFSALLAIYAPDAVLTASTPNGATTVATGTAQLQAFFTHFRSIHPGLVFAVDSVRVLSPHIVLTYEHALPPGFSEPGRCMHLYTIQHGQVQSLDWATFYPGER